MKPAMRFGIALALVGAIGACSSDSTGPDFRDDFTAGTASYFGEVVISSAEDAMELMHWGAPLVGMLGAPAFTGAGRTHHGVRPRPSPVPQAVAGASISSYLSQLQLTAPGCTISGHGSDGDAFDPYDGNENGIPDDWYLKLVCDTEEEIGEGVTVAYHDEMEIRIKERTDILWGWNASLKQRWTDRASDGSDHDEEYNEVTEALAVTLRRAEYSREGKYGGNGLDGTDPYFGEDGGDLKLVYVSYDDDIELGSLFPAGQAGLTGRLYTFDTDNPGWEWRISTTEPLIWSPECVVDTDDPFIEGVVSVLLNGDAEKGFILDTGGCDLGWDIDIFGDTPPEAVALPQRAPRFSFPKR